MYTFLVWEAVQPEFSVVHNFDDQSVWQYVERQCVDDCPCPFLHCSNESFDLWYMLMPSCDVHIYAL